jgi:uncharacterized membrane protein YhaH (DUF805 family)
MKCKSCGHVLYSFDKYCPKCEAVNLEYNFNRRKDIEELVKVTKRKAPEPRYGLVGFFRMFKNALDFNGGVDVREYWNNVIIQLLFLIPYFHVYIASRFNSESLSLRYISFVFIFTIVFVTITIIPMLSLTIRRLHDAGYPGIYYLFNFIPFIGSFIIFFLTINDYQSNEYSDIVGYVEEDFK